MPTSRIAVLTSHGSIYKDSRYEPALHRIVKQLVRLQQLGAAPSQELPLFSKLRDQQPYNRRPLQCAREIAHAMSQVAWLSGERKPLLRNASVSIKQAF